MPRLNAPAPTPVSGKSRIIATVSRQITRRPHSPSSVVSCIRIASAPRFAYIDAIATRAATPAATPAAARPPVRTGASDAGGDPGGRAPAGQPRLRQHDEHRQADAGGEDARARQRSKEPH